MQFIKDYKPTHYKYYLYDANLLISNHNEIDTWVRTLSESELKYWVKTISKLKNNDTEYYEECTVLLTLVIKLFINELNYDNAIKLNDSEIEKIFSRFELILKKEYSKVLGIKQKETIKYSLLIDN